MLTGSLTCLALIAGRLAGPGANLRPSLAAGTALSLDELRGEMRQVERAARVTRHVETGAGILVIAFGVAGTAWAPQITAKAGFALMSAGAAFVVLYMRRHALRPLPMDLGFDASRVAFRDALVQGERLLRRVWLWYLLPLIVGPLVLIVGWSVAQRRSFASALGFLGIMAVMSVLAWRMNRDAANRLLSRRIPGIGQDRRAGVADGKRAAVPRDRARPLAFPGGGSARPSSPSPTCSSRPVYYPTLVTPPPTLPANLAAPVRWFVGLLLGVALMSVVQVILWLRLSKAH